ncbi:putative alkaline shock family protein YloU [Fontibacillus phaseoli]|uniref:Putative alkaline shock family protein YloU n=1 Tax=Fontibacillus phaseoli TaxID=1416533 RepID=A0A369BQU3_9BACL|nr:Asp23/Gls24 family envelope stress response protein [Fontibacillus phaseoli]RCX23761.1 putative alkaline shock family protein YloU [Fontibacillus phaseoli]
MYIENRMGKIKISKDVIYKIVGKAAIATSGIAKMSSGIGEGLANWINGKSLENGIELKEAERGLDIRLSVVIQYRTKISAVLQELQNNVREAVAGFTGLSVGSINVIVEGISVK